MTKKEHIASVLAFEKNWYHRMVICMAASGNTRIKPRHFD